MTRYSPTAFPYVCANCSRSHSETDWLTLERVGEMGDHVETLELRNCQCGGTMGARLATSPADQCPPTLRTGSAPVCSLCRREVKEQAEGSCMCFLRSRIGAKTVTSKLDGQKMDRDYNGARGIFLRALGDQPALLRQSASAPESPQGDFGSEK